MKIFGSNKGFYRKNFHRRKYKKNYIKNYIKIIYTFLIITFIIIIYLITNNAINPIFEELCSDKAKSIATKITNEQSTNVMKKHSYEEMFTIEKDETGNIQMIKANIMAIDEITSDIASYIQESLEKQETTQIKLPIGSFTSIKFISGIGPNIKIKISSTGEVATDLRSEFVAQGINQTIHRIYLQIDCTVNILTPFKTIKENISNQVLLIENVIMGNVPEVFLGTEEKSTTLN